MALPNKTFSSSKTEGLNSSDLLRPLLLKERTCHSTKRGYSLAVIIMNAVYLEVGINQTMKNRATEF